MIRTRQQHLDRSIVPKRILSLDGGGIRGVLSLEYLTAIEALLRKRSGKSELLLCDYFDLIGGTSTGAIIAAALACGMSVADLKRIYTELGESVFKDKFWRRGLLVAKFPSGPLRAALETHLGADTTMDDERVRTGLMIMTKRLDTGSLWPLHNHPDAAYGAQDGRLSLVQVVRASTAAPTYFEPETIQISSRDGNVVSGAFVDGGVSPFNDPALQLLMVASLQGHGFRWQTGADKLLLVSVGTGVHKVRYAASELSRMAPAEQGLRALQSLMDDCGRVSSALLQWLTACVTVSRVDRALGDLMLDSRAGPQLATYVRYNAQLDAAWLKTELDLERTPGDLQAIAQMDDPRNMAQLADIGTRAALKQVREGHFPPQFDI